MFRRGCVCISQPFKIIKYCLHMLQSILNPLWSREETLDLLLLAGHRVCRRGHLFPADVQQ